MRRVRLRLPLRFVGLKMPMIQVKTKPPRETDVARPVVAWLRDQGWEVYQEVRGLDADIVAVLGRRVWIIEAKRFLSWKLISQACRKIGFANWVSIAVPEKCYSQNAGIVLSHWGIGCLEASKSLERFDVWERLKPRVNKRPILQYVYDQLDERQKTYCEAGSPGGAAWSPFKDTCERLRKLVGAHPGIALKDTIEQIEHHYSSSASARCALSHWIKLGKVKGIRAERGRVLRLFSE